MTPLHLWGRSASLRSWVVCVGGGVKKRQELIASLGLLSALFHTDHKLLHITAFSGQEGQGQEEAPCAFSFFGPELILSFFLCFFFFLPPLTTVFLSSLCSQAFKLIYPSSDRVI